MALILIFALPRDGSSGPAGPKGDKGDTGNTGSFADPTSVLSLTYQTSKQACVDVAVDENAMSCAHILQLHRNPAVTPASVMPIAFGLARAHVAGLTATSSGHVGVCGSSGQACSVFLKGADGQIFGNTNPQVIASSAIFTANTTGFVPTRADNTYCATRGSGRGSPAVATCYTKRDLVGETARAALRSVAEASATVMSVGVDDRGRGLVQTGSLSDFTSDVPLLVNPLGGGVHVGTEVPITVASGSLDSKLFVNGSIQCNRGYFSSVVTAPAMSVSGAVTANTLTVTQQLTSQQQASFNEVIINGDGLDASAPRLTVIGPAVFQGNVTITGHLSTLSSYHAAGSPETESLSTAARDKVIDLMKIKVRSCQGQRSCVHPADMRRYWSNVAFYTTKQQDDTPMLAVDLQGMIYDLLQIIQAQQKQINQLDALLRQ